MIDASELQLFGFEVITSRTWVIAPPSPGFVATVLPPGRRRGTKGVVRSASPGTRSVDGPAAHVRCPVGVSGLVDGPDAEDVRPLLQAPVGLRRGAGLPGTSVEPAFELRSALR